MKTKRIASSLLIVIMLFTCCTAISFADAVEEEYRTSTELNVRSGAGMNHPVIDVLEKNAAVQVLDRSGKWSKVAYTGGTGYVFSSYLAKYAPRYANADDLNIRTGPGTSYKVIGVLQKGDPILVGSKSGKWTKVSYEGQIGYVFTKYLSSRIPKTEWPKDEPKLKQSTAPTWKIKGLSLALKKDSFREDRVILEPYFVNDTRSAYEFGFPYSLEKKINGKWYVLPEDPDVDYPMIGFYLAPNTDTSAASDSDPMNFVWDLSDGYGLYGKLTAGKYRLVWELENENTGKTVSLFAEFKVK